MGTLLIILHVIVCIALIIIVLVQGGKGAEIGASFGAGSSQTVFGATGGQTFIQKLTTSAAAIFMLTSLTLAYFHGKPGGDSVMPDSVKATAPATAPAPPAAVPASKPADSAAKTKSEPNKK